jgi:hypothetical protein
MLAEKSCVAVAKDMPCMRAADNKAFSTSKPSLSLDLNTPTSVLRVDIPWIIGEEVIGISHHERRHIIPQKHS